jgi:hypothetical protein
MVFLSLLIFALVADESSPKVKVTGKLYTYWTMMENNDTDFSSFDAAHPDLTNDARSYAEGRLDVNFNIDIAKDVFVKVGTRFEGKTNADDKWMYFGKYTRTDDEGNITYPQLKDGAPTLQEAYVEFRNLFGQPLTFDFGRKLENYNVNGENSFGNVMSTYDKVDGLKLGYVNDIYFANLHYYIMENQQDVGAIEGEKLDKIIGVVGGIKNKSIVEDAYAYYWMRSKAVSKTTDPTNDLSDTRNVIGARADFTFFDGMITPFIEVAMQSGTNEALVIDEATPTVPATYAEVDYDGMLIDLGAGFERDLGPSTVDAAIRYLSVSGDDAKTDDTNEAFTGIGLGITEQGWNLVNPMLVQWNMVKLSLGVTPATMDKLRLGLDFWMFGDASENYDGISGENMYNEIGFCASYAMYSNVDIMLGYNYLMPNEDAQNLIYDDAVTHGDAASALWFETDIRW